VTDPLDPDELWFAHLLASIPAPASLDSWTPPVTAPPRPRPRRRSRVTPLVLALAVAVLVGVVGAGLGVVLPRRGGSPAQTANTVIPGMPPARAGEAMAPDPSHHRVVLFGGHATAGLLGDTWTWDGHRWSRDLLAGGPPERAAAGMAPDPTGGVVLFGGVGRAGALGDTWRWDGHAWSALHPSAAPPATPAPLMAADPTTRAVLLVVRDPNTAAPVSTWTWDGHTWARRPTATAPPSCAAAMAADPGSRRVLLITGRSCPALAGGVTWSWDGQAWTALHPAAAPPALDRLVLGGGAGHLVLFSPEPDPAHGCAARLTWTLDGATWTAHAAPVSPPSTGAAATDPDTGALILLTTSGETWRWIGAAWELGEAAAPPQGAAPPTPRTERSPASCPAGRTGAVMVTDEARHQVLLFGGSASPLGPTPPVPGDTWIWDGSTWSQLHPNPAPPGRSGAAAAFDPLRSVVVLYGGVGLDDKGHPVAFDATWTWNGSAWKRQSPKTAPPGRRLVSMAWDPGGRTMILVTGDSLPSAETWSWDGAQWTRLHPHATPPYGALVTAPDLGGLLLASPTGPDGRPSTWSWSGGDWHRLVVAGTPAVSGPALAYEAGAHRVVLFGGDCPTGHCPTDATWTYDGHSWMELRPSGSPPPRAGASLAADASRPGLLLFGGGDFARLWGDTWVFT
jgi:hypothetical protein